MLLMQLAEYVRARYERLSHPEDGQALVEYALILSLVSIAGIALLTIIGTDVKLVLKGIANALVPGSGN